MLRDARFVSVIVAGLVGASLFLIVTDAFAPMSDGTAAFAGALIAAGVGFLGLIVAALFNAQLQREEAERIREEERRGAALVLLTKIDVAVMHLLRIVSGLHSIQRKGQILDQNAAWLKQRVPEFLESAQAIVEHDAARYALLPPSILNHVARVLLAISGAHGNIRSFKDESAAITPKRAIHNRETSASVLGGAAHDEGISDRVLEAGRSEQ